MSDQGNRFASVDLSSLFASLVIGPGGRVSREVSEAYGRAKALFTQMLGQATRGAAFVKEVFALMDQLTAEYLASNSIACHNGCDRCCFQLVCCTTLEMELICEHVRALPSPRRTHLRDRLEAHARQFNREIRAAERCFPASQETTAAIMMQLHEGRVCPYLVEHSCSIYPVRPVDCRSAMMRVPCGAGGVPAEGARVRLMLGQVASDRIMVEEETVHGSLQVSPLTLWPLSREFAGRF